MTSSSQTKDLFQLFSILHQYVSAGVNPIDGIALYAQNSRSSVKAILEDVLVSVRNGSDLPSAMEKHPDFFPTFITQMLRVNDKTGQGDSIYESIEQTLEQEIDLRRNVGSEMIPIMVLFIALIAAFCVAVFFVIPMMGEMLKDMGVELPLLTRFFIGVADFAVNYWFLVLVGAGALVLGYLHIRINKPRLYAKILLRLPFYKLIVFNQIQYRFARIFGLCIEAGIETSKALEYTASAADNILLKDLLLQANNSINRTGADLVAAIKKANTDDVLDASFYTMLEAGKSGNMEHILAKCATYFKKQLLAVSKTFGTKLSLTLITPGFVLLIAVFLSVYMPVFSLMGKIGTQGGIGQ